MTLKASRGKVLLGTFAPLKHRTNCRSNVSKSVGFAELREFAIQYRGNHCGDGLKQAVGRTYGVTSVIGPLEVYHTIQASERRPSTLTAVGIQLLLRKNVSTTLGYRVN